MAFITFTAFLLISCSEDSQKVYILSDITSIDAKGGVVNISITANCAWTLSKTENGTNKTIVKNGEGDNTIKLTITGNTEYEMKRIVLSLTSEDQTSFSEITILQNEQKGILIDESNKKIEVKPEGDKIQINIRTNVQNITLNAPEWIKLSQISTRSLDDKICVLEIDENRTGVYRDANVSFQGEDINTALFISQDYVKIYPTEIQFESGNALFFDTNCTYQLIPVYYPTDTTEKDLLWSSSDNTIATVDENGIVTVVDNGECQIKAMNENSGVCAIANIQNKIKAERLYAIFPHTFGFNQKETIKFKYEPANAYVDDVYIKNDNTSYFDSKGLSIQTKSQAGELLLNIIDPYSGKTIDNGSNYITIQQFYSEGGTYTVTLWDPVYEASFEARLYSANPLDKIEIYGVNLLDKDNYVVDVSCSKTGDGTNSVYFVSKKIDLTKYEGVMQYHELMETFKFIVHFSINGEPHDEIIPCKMGNIRDDEWWLSW